MKIEEMRVEQRGKDVLHHHEQADPVRKPLAAKHQEMQKPHRIEHDDADNPPLDCNIQGLIMRIANDLRSGISGGTRSSLLEEPASRSRAVPHDWGFAEESQRLLPVFEPLADRGGRAVLPVEPVVSGETVDG